MDVKIFHVLNGDALKDRFPASIKGEVIVMRECLVEGSVLGDDLPTFLKTRAKFIYESYKSPESDYYKKVASEFEKIQSIPDGSQVNLWFEDDLFCQTNFWCIVHLIYSSNKRLNPFIVRPEKLSSFGFGGLNNLELTELLKKHQPIDDLSSISSLWRAYQADDRDTLEEIASNLTNHFPFILPAVKAHLDRKRPNKLGRPEMSLLRIMRELRSREFRPVFREFCKREPIYGFGDSQVKRMYDSLIGS